MQRSLGSDPGARLTQPPGAGRPPQPQPLSPGRPPPPQQQQQQQQPNGLYQGSMQAMASALPASPPVPYNTGPPTPALRPPAASVATASAPLPLPEMSSAPRPWGMPPGQPVSSMRPPGGVRPPPSFGRPPPRFGRPQQPLSPDGPAQQAPPGQQRQQGPPQQQRYPGPPGSPPLPPPPPGGSPGRGVYCSKCPISIVRGRPLLMASAAYGCYGMTHPVVFKQGCRQGTFRCGTRPEACCTRSQQGRALIHRRCHAQQRQQRRLGNSRRGVTASTTSHRRLQTTLR